MDVEPRRYEEPADRLTNGLRFIWIIPAAIIGIGIAIALAVVLFITWWAILFTGKHPRGMFDFTMKGLRYSLQLTAYGLLMTDTYPKWGTGGEIARPASSPLPPPPGRGTLPPPSPSRRDRSRRHSNLRIRTSANLLSSTRSQGHGGAKRARLFE